jgi:dihydropyrimidinase
MRVPVLYHRGVHEGRISLNRFVELSSANAAKIMGLYPRKGAIALGSDADLVVIDPAGAWTVSAGSHHMSPDYNCWEGWELQGRVRTTILRGTVLVDDGRWVGPKGAGRFQERRLLPEVVASPPDFTLTHESAGVASAAPSA